MNIAIKHVLIGYRNLPAIAQFREGASIIMDLACKHPCQMQQLFVAGVAPSVLSFTSFRQLYDIRWSEEGANRRAEEEETVFAFEVCLQKCEGQSLTFQTFSRE